MCSVRRQRSFDLTASLYVPRSKGSRGIIKAKPCCFSGNRCLVMLEDDDVQSSDWEGYD